MKKTIFSLSLLPFLLIGCTYKSESLEPTKKIEIKSTIEYPSEEELLKIVANGEELLKTLFKGSSYYDKNPISLNGFTYGKYTNYNSKEEILEKLSPYFKKEVIDNILNRYMITINKTLYFVMGDAGLRVNYDKSEKNFHFDKDKITVTFSDKSLEVEEKKVLKLINGKWKFCEFWYV